MKMKKLFSIAVSLTIVASAVFASATTAFAKPEPIIQTNLPKTMKIGESFEEDWENGNITVSNLQDYVGYSIGTKDINNFGSAYFWARAGAGPDDTVKENGNGYTVIKAIGSDSPEDELYWSVYRPGKYSFQVYVQSSNPKQLLKNKAEVVSNQVDIGKPIELTVEEPVIKSNAPGTIEVGSTLQLNTELTNTALKNTDVAYYLNEKNHHYEDGEFRGIISDATHQKHNAAYQPSVEILEGKDLVEQTEQDYTNTLKSNETLKFSGVGTVKLKVKYNQLITCACLYDYETDAYNTYSPEEIITIEVTNAESPDIPSLTDKTELNDLVTEKGQLSASDYTDETFEKYSQALANAKDVLNDPNATAQQIAQAQAALETAIKELESIEKTEPSNEEKPTLSGQSDKNPEKGHNSNGEKPTSDSQSNNIPQKGDNSNNEKVTSSNQSNKMPKTGDNLNVSVFVFSLILSGFVVTTLMLSKKMRKFKIFN